MEHVRSDGSTERHAMGSEAKLVWDGGGQCLSFSMMLALAEGGCYDVDEDDGLSECSVSRSYACMHVASASSPEDLLAVVLQYWVSSRRVPHVFAAQGTHVQPGSSCSMKRCITSLPH